MGILLPDYEKSSTYTAAVDWFGSFQPDPSLDYGIALEHAITSHQEMVSRYATLDRKAEWLFTTAVATVCGLFWVADKLSVSPKACLPSAFLLILAACMCLRVRWPMGKPATYSVRDTLNGILQDQPAGAWLAASYHCAIIGHEFVTTWKARQIAYAASVVVLAVAWFVGLYFV